MKKLILILLFITSLSYSQSLMTASPATTFGGILHFNGNTGLTTTLQTVYDGLGNVSALQLSSNSVNVVGTLYVNGISPFDTITMATTSRMNDSLANMNLRKVAYSDSLSKYVTPTQTGVVSIASFAGANDSIQVANALASIGSNATTLLFTPKTWHEGHQTFPSNVALQFMNGAILNDSCVIKGSVQAGLYQIFSTAQNLDSAKIDAVYPEWWGAKADNSTDCTWALQTAINTGNEVELASGSYRTYSTININGFWGNLIRGKGVQTYINFAGSGVAIEIAQTTPVQYLKISDLSLSGNSSADGGIELGQGSSNYCGNLKFDNVVIAGFTKINAFGLRINALQEGDFNNCIFRSNYNNIWYPSTASYMTTTSFRGYASYIGDALEYGVLIEGNGNPEINFIQNIFEGNNNDAIRCISPAGAQIHIDRCYFEGNNATDSLDQNPAIWITPSTNTSLSRFSISKCVFSTYPLPHEALYANNISGVIDNNSQFLDNGFYTGSGALLYLSNNHSFLSSSALDAIYRTQLGEVVVKDFNNNQWTQWAKNVTYNYDSLNINGIIKLSNRLNYFMLPSRSGNTFGRVFTTETITNNDQVGLSLNGYTDYNNILHQDKNTLPTWELLFDLGLDSFILKRAPAGSTDPSNYKNIFSVSNNGSPSIPNNAYYSAADTGAGINAQLLGLDNSDVIRFNPAGYDWVANGTATLGTANKTGVSALYIGSLFIGTTERIDASGNLFNIGTINSGAITSSGTIKTAGYTVATLPAGTIGMTAYVTDATAPTYLGTLTGGGTVTCPVFYNGTAWVSY